MAQRKNVKRRSFPDSFRRFTFHLSQMTGSLLPSMVRSQDVLEYVVGHEAALRDSLGLVEQPVDAEIDAALTVFLLRLREGGEAAFHDRPYVAGVITRHAVEFVRDEGK